MNDMVYLSFSLLQKCSCHSPKASTSEDSFDKAWKVSAYYITVVVGKCSIGLQKSNYAM